MNNPDLGSFPDLYFSKIDNIPLGTLSVSQRLELYSEMSSYFDYDGYTVSSRIAKNRSISSLCAHMNV